MMFIRFFLCIFFLIGSFNPPLWAFPATSLCNNLDKAKCIEDTNLLGHTPFGNEEAIFYDHFQIMNGYPGHNNERETYKPSQFVWNPNNTFSLIAEAREVDGFPFVSGKVQTAGKFLITSKDGIPIKHGAVEVTSKVPYGFGRWPAIWMMPNFDRSHPWPAGMEIDILEFMSNSGQLLSTIHYGNQNSKGISWNYNNNTVFNPIIIPNNTEHTYGFEWNVGDSQAFLTWFLDGKAYFQISMTHKGTVYEVILKDINTKQTRNLTCVTDRCPLKFGTSLEEAAYTSFMDGFFGHTPSESAGYYLIINMAVGGNGVTPAPDPFHFPNTDMNISSIHRYIIN